MTACNGRKLWLMIGLAAGAFGLWSLGGGTRGAPREPATEQQPQPGPKNFFYGVAACSGCHKNDPKQDDPWMCRCIEFTIWNEKDKHKDAHKVLKGELALKMAKRLGIKGDISEDKSCISCHATVAGKDDARHASFKLSEGVSCGICHGPHKEWYSKHSDLFERDEWRALSRKTKEEKYGMYDLWDPARRATLCAGCHIGDAKTGRVVTHEMYAAGHPPLPNLEVATFSDHMPRHWQYLYEKKEAIQKLLQFDKETLERTELLVISGVVAFRESMKLLENQAGHAEHGWPEFAQFDCYACHHDLKAQGWRQDRGHTGRPGRPGMRRWPTALVRLAIRHAAGEDQALGEKLTADYDRRLKDLSAAFDAQPFGDPKKVAAAAGAAAAWADELLTLVRKQPFHQAAARRLLTALGTPQQKGRLDFESARQVAWAYKVLLDDGFRGKTPVAQDKEVNQLYQSLSTQLRLELIQGQAEIATDFLPGYLDAIGKYEPEAFRRTFDALTGRVKVLSK